MKTIQSFFIAGSLMFSTFALQAQSWTTSSSNLYLNPTTANVGIGTSAVTDSKLYLVHSSTSTAATYGLRSTMSNSSTGTGGVYGAYFSGSKSNSGASGSVYGLYSTASNASATGTVYGIYSSVSGASGTIKRSGYFTGGDLEVNASVRTKDVIFGDDNHQYIIAASWQQGDPPKLYIAPKILGTETWDWNKQIILQNDGSMIMSAGYLDVKNHITISATNDDLGGFLELRNERKTQLGIGQSWKIYNMTGTYGNSLQFWAYDNIGCNTGGLCFNRVTFMDNGNVGIGILTPGTKLDVAGTVRAHEVKVCLNQGCDYVFADDYKLMNINDVANFVKTNHHLPDVAPAAQMESEGINLSEMNALLLRKVEELTLYVIDLNKQVQELKAGK